MLTKTDIQSILDQIKFRDWEFYLGDKSGVLYLQIQFTAPCNTTGEPKVQHCRKWLLSQYMTQSEIVGTAWLAIEQAVKHEAAEQFTYRGQPIFDFHLNVNWLAQVREHCGENILDLRPSRPWEARLKSKPTS